jgi:single-strand DNA-binding protein
MPDIITLTGLVATTPRHILTSEGLSITSFRLASTQRRFDRSVERWIDGETNWYTITSFRQLALNCSTSIEKGQRVLVTGRLRIREWDNGERVGTTIDIEAESVGHDLSWGTARFTRSIVSSAPPAVEPEIEHQEATTQTTDETADGVAADDARERPDAELAAQPTVPF